MRALELKIPPAALMLLVVSSLHGYGFWQTAQLLPSCSGWALLGLTLVVAGVACCLMGVWSFRQARTTVNPMAPAQASKLVIRGIYHISRNPMYLGFALMVLGVGVAWQQLSSVLWTLLFMAYLQKFQIQPEERALTALFGEDYLQYCQQVRRWL